jgi:hypothetical protein
MSIFQIKELWSARVGNHEEFHRHSICLGNLDNAKPPDNKVAVGSFEGYLRVYHPQTRDYRVTDLILERNMLLPILQVEAGRFSGVEGQTSLAVLHSRRLLVALITTKGGSEPPTYQVLYEHAFDRNAFNLVAGHFGCAMDRHLLCV